MPNKVHLIITAAALGILAAVLGYVAYQQNQPTPNTSPSAPTAPSVSSQPPAPAIDTSNWQTYRNDKYGFEVKYPPTWVAQKFPDETSPPSFTGDIFSFVLQDAKLAEKQKSFFDREDLFVGFQITDLRNTIGICEAKDKGCVTRTINGAKATIITYLDSDPGEGYGNKGRDIEFRRGGRVFRFYTGFDGIPQDKSILNLSRETFMIDKIASTFKFIR